MHYKPNYSIYLQVADYMCEKILTESWKNSEKIPSLRELSMETSVNPNTVVKSLNWLQDHGILQTRRGIGYFLTDTALEKTVELKRNQFIREDLPEVFTNMKLLNVGMEEFRELFEQQRKQRKLP